LSYPQDRPCFLPAMVRSIYDFVRDTLIFDHEAEIHRLDESCQRTADPYFVSHWLTTTEFPHHYCGALEENPLEPESHPVLSSNQCSPELCGLYPKSSGYSADPVTTSPSGFQISFASSKIFFSPTGSPLAAASSVLCTCHQVSKYPSQVLTYLFLSITKRVSAGCCSFRFQGFHAPNSRTM
jgi:hypothetical protein